MRIPRSTIVMAVVTMVPFGLAIRDVAKGDGQRLTADEVEAAKLLAEEEAYERERAAELAAEEAAEQAVLDARARDLPQLFGAEPASLGPAFGALRLGMPSEAVDDALPPLMTLTRATGIWYTPAFEAGALTRVALDLIGGRDDDDDRCEVVAAVLGTRWGAPTTGEDTRVWRHPTTGLRAILDDSEGCTYTIESSVDVAGWVDARARTAIVPLWLLGQRVDKLMAILPPDAQRDEDGNYAWTGPGLGLGLGATELSATTIDGKLVGLQAATRVVGGGTQSELEAHLTAQLGTPAQDPDDVLRWTRPAVTVLRLDDVITLTAGEVP